MKLAKYIVFARRILPCGTVSNITKAVSEQTPIDALIEFCHIVGISPRILDTPEIMGTAHWEVVIYQVSECEYNIAFEVYNRNPIRSDFRTS